MVHLELKGMLLSNKVYLVEETATTINMLPAAAPPRPLAAPGTLARGVDSHPSGAAAVQGSDNLKVQ